MAKTRGSSDNTKRQLPKRVPPLTASRAFGQKSPLVEADLQAFMALCFSTGKWQMYTVEEKERILECLPQSRRLKHGLVEPENPQDHKSYQPLASEIPDPCGTSTHRDVHFDGTALLPPNSSDIGTDTYVKRAVARFQRDLGDGYYEKSWQDKAQRAHQERMHGKFDAYVRQHAEEMFEDDGSPGDDNGNDEDELAQQSEDGEYLDTSRKGGRGKGRPRKTR